MDRGCAAGDAIRIRDADGHDRDILFAIERRTLLLAYAEVFPADRYPFPDEQVRAEWATVLAAETMRTAIAEVRGVAVGTVTVDPPQLKRLFVLPEYQEQGIGRLLHDRALEMLGAAGTATAELLVLEANERARLFYQRRGWRQYGPARPAAYPPYPPVLTYRLSR